VPSTPVAPLGDGKQLAKKRARVKIERSEVPTAARERQFRDAHGVYMRKPRAHGHASEWNVPIVLDLEASGARLQTRLTWSLRETATHPEVFADALCRELKLPASLAAAVAREIRAQVAAYPRYAPLPWQAGLKQPDCSEMLMPLDIDVSVAGVFSSHHSLGLSLPAPLPLLSYCLLPSTATIAPPALNIRRPQRNSGRR
jgi:hypothetical protein